MRKRKGENRDRKDTPEPAAPEPEDLPEEEEPQALKQARQKAAANRDTLRNLGDVIRYSGPRF